MPARSLCLLLSACLCLLLAALASAQGSPEEPILCLDPGGHTASVGEVLFSPDGRELFSIGQDKVIRDWDAETGEALRSFRGQVGPSSEGRLYAASLSPDGRILAVGGYGTPETNEHLGDIRLFDRRTGDILRLLGGHTGTVHDLAFSPDGKWLASGSADKTVRLWDTGTWECRRVLKGHEGVVAGLAWSPDSRKIASAGHDGTTRVWDTGTGDSRYVLRGSPAKVLSVAWSPDGRTLAAGSADRSFRFWDMPAGKPLRTFSDLPNHVRTLAFSPDGTWLAVGLGGTATRGNGVQLWSVTEGKAVREFTRHDNTVSSVAFSPDGSTVASAGGNADEIYLWDPRTGALRLRLAGTGSVVLSIAWSTDGRRVAWGNTSLPEAASNRRPLEHTFDLVQGRIGPESAPGSGEAWRGAVLQQAGRTLAAAEDGDGVVLNEGDQETGRIKLSQPQDRVRSFTFTPSGGIVIGSGLALSLYDSRGQRLREFEGHLALVYAVAVSPDGRYLASGGGDQTVRIWPLRTETAVAAPVLSLFRGSDGEWVAWTPQGYYACSPGGERLIGWQVNRGLDRAADYYPAYQFRRRFYRPDVIARLLEAGSTPEAVRLADAERHGATDPALVADRLAQFAPPKVDLLSPAEGAEVDAAEVTVRARIADPNGRKITGVTLLVNGRKQESRRIVLVPTGGTPWEGTAVLAPGRNTLSVLAVNDAGAESVPVNRVLSYRTAVAEEEKPGLYLLSIGVTRYQKPEFNLKFAAKDATDFAAAYRSQEGKLFRKVTQKVLTDAGATRGEVMDGLDWLSKEVTQRDWAIVFISGHGIADNLNQYYFGPYDVDPERLKRTGVVWSDLRTTLANLPGKVILVLDTCHSAGVTGERTRGGDAYTELLRDAVTDETGLITLASCMPRELSFERDEWQNGAFTRALTEALGGKGDTHRDGIITLAELDAYVAERVKS